MAALKIQNEGDLQSELMPQELNPAFVPDEPLRAIFPLRQRRDLSDTTLVNDTTLAQVKSYSRIVACTVLAVSALIEIIVYVVESYYVT
ncbi:unnamed protein product [Leptidea sinapis]|uniref:Uncharacterized protein n=1 Tax=Leptidea sinapis TaxID=189913 RepID=A0A5E4QES0_9NEOP|nr:unnamed protein product [Leptidea sinapis]